MSADQVITVLLTLFPLLYFSLIRDLLTVHTTCIFTSEMSQLSVLLSALTTTLREAFFGGRHDNILETGFWKPHSPHQKY